MNVTRRLIEWCDNTFKKALREEDDRKANAKVIASGAVEGFMDGAIMMYLPLLIACFYYQSKATGK